MRAAEFVRSYFDAWNRLDGEGVAAHLAEGGVYCDVAESAQLTHESFREMLREYFDEHRHAYQIVGDVMEFGQSISFRYRMSPLVKAKRSESSKEEPIEGAEFITLLGDTAISIHDFYQDLGNVANARKRATTRAAHRAKYAKSGLTEDQLAAYKANLNRIMCDERAFLRANLTLPDLSRLVGCSVNHLSQVINAGFDSSFFDYVNRFRIERAKELLASNRAGGAVINYAFEVGFNSNSAFYTAFKKFTGQTPAQYRRSQLPSTDAASKRP
ncbi:MAG: helix-turn-helix domain-containing protein [Pseudomonadota bacterium]